MSRCLDLVGLALVAVLPAAVVARLKEPPPVARAAPQAFAAAERTGTADLSIGVGKGGARPFVIPRADDGMFYVRARVNGVPIRFLVDTGASVIVLTDSDAAAIGVGPLTGLPGESLRTAGGDAATRWTKLGTVRMAGREFRGLDAAVIERGPGVSLLGQNLLSKLDSIMIEPERMVVR